MRRLLITGSQGAFGPFIVRHFSELADYTVFTSDLLGQSDERHFPCDCRVAAEVESLLKECFPDEVIHLAGTIRSDFDFAMEVNFCATRVLLEQVKGVCPHARVVLTGSAAEYGAVNVSDNPVNETSALAPVSSYGLTKSFQSMLVPFYAAQRLDVLLARPFNLMGPNLSENLFVGRVQSQIRQIKEGLDCKVRVGSLDAIRDYITFGEAARQYEAIARFGKRGQVYHVGSGKPTSIRALLLDMVMQAGLDVSVVEESPSNSNRMGYDVPVIYANMSKTMKLMAKFGV